MSNIHCHEKKCFCLSTERRTKASEPFSFASTAPIPKLSYMMMNIRLLSLSRVCFVMNLRLLLIFILVSREKGSAGMRKTTKAIKKCSSASGGRTRSILATIRELVKYLMELYLHCREWVVGFLNMESRGRV